MRCGMLPRATLSVWFPWKRQQSPQLLKTPNPDHCYSHQQTAHRCAAHTHVHLSNISTTHTHTHTHTHTQLPLFMQKHKLTQTNTHTHTQTHTHTRSSHSLHMRLFKQK